MCCDKGTGVRYILRRDVVGVLPLLLACCDRGTVRGAAIEVLHLFLAKTFLTDEAPQRQ